MWCSAIFEGDPNSFYVDARMFPILPLLIRFNSTWDTTLLGLNNCVVQFNLGERSCYFKKKYFGFAIFEGHVKIWIQKLEGQIIVIFCTRNYGRVYDGWRISKSIFSFKPR